MQMPSDGGEALTWRYSHLDQGKVRTSYKTGYQGLFTRIAGTLAPRFSERGSRDLPSLVCVPTEAIDIYGNRLELEGYRSVYNPGIEIGQKGGYLVW